MELVKKKFEWTDKELEKLYRENVERRNFHLPNVQLVLEEKDAYVHSKATLAQQVWLVCVEVGRVVSGVLNKLLIFGVKGVHPRAGERQGFAAIV